MTYKESKKVTGRIKEVIERLEECRDYIEAVTLDTLYGDSDHADIELLGRVEESLEKFAKGYYGKV